MTCEIKKINRDYYLPENDDVANLEINQTVLIKEQFIQHILHSDKPIRSQNKADFTDSPFSDEWYPYVNSYYQYTEDVDAFARVSHLLGSKPSFASLSSVECRSQYEPIQDKIPYSETTAQLQYLESNPFSFIILGKPGIGEHELGKQLADYWKCVYIDPEILIEQEIASGSRAGQCIQFNLKCGRAIGIDVILRLVEKRVKSESAKHRGFVICGLPLIPNDLYQEDPISSESAVFTVKEIFEEMFDTTMERAHLPPGKPPVSVSSKYRSEEGEFDEEEEKDDIEKEDDVDKEDAEEEVLEEEGDSPKPLPSKVPLESKIPEDIGPDFDLCHGPEISTNYEDQLNFIFDLMKPPFMIIYMMCSTADVIEKRKNYRYDVQLKQTINLQTEIYNNLILNHISKLETPEEEIPENFLDTEYLNVDTTQLNYLVKLPRHFPANVSTQLDSFHYAGLNFLDRRVLMHDPQYYLKVDGRVSVQRMLDIIKSRLKILPIQSVVLPVRLNTEPIDFGEEESQEFKTDPHDLDDAYRELSMRQVPSNVFKWNWSDWGTRCPVALKAGILTDGDPNYAVHFMNKIFFLANEENFFKFYRNPRPYLLPPCPRSTCKIFIFGPKYSGRTAVARCLGFLLNGTVLSIEEVLRQFLMNQEEELKEKIRQQAIAEALKALNEQRAEEAKKLEAERIEKIKEWVTATKRLIEDVIGLIVETGKDQTVTSFEISSFPMAMKKVSMVEAETSLAIEFIRAKDQIQNLRIPFSYKIEDWQALLADKRKLLTYLPHNLRTKVTPKPATVFDDFVLEYAKNAVDNADLHDASLNNKSLVQIIINHIKSVEEEQIRKGNNRGGWILDGMLTDLFIIEDMYPDFLADEVIVLRDEENSEFLINRFIDKGEHDFYEYRDFFMNIGKLDAAWRSPSKIPKKCSKTSIVKEILSDIINDPNTFDYDDAGPVDKVDGYRQEVQNFNEKWEEIRKYFLDHNIVPIEVRITDMSISDLMKCVIRKLEDRYRVKASVYTELDRAEEVKNFGNQTLHKSSGGEADFGAGEAFEQNRRYGDTYHYCPVTFHDKWVLWKGKEDYAVKFENKLYLLSGEEDMNKFIENPRHYLKGEPPEALPPPRICVIGIPGTGRTSISKALADNYGLYYASFESLVKRSLNITSSESFEEMRRNENTDANLNAYLNVNVPLPDNLLEDSIHIDKFWFEQPDMGFVLDDFPKRPSDVMFMTKHKLIPDVVINLTNTPIQVKKIIVQQHLNRWEVEIAEKRMMLEEENKVVRSEWEKKRNKRFEELIEEKREQRYSLKMQQKESRDDLDDEEVEPVGKSGFTTDSQVSFDSVAEQDDIKEVNQLLDEELPEPVFDDILESLNDALEKFEALATDTINVENGFLNNIKALCASEGIPVVDVLIDFDYPERTTRGAFVAADKFKFRTKSHFERCFDVSVEVAERLLSCGYFFLSKFGKTCPVQYYEDKNPIQMYVPLEQKHNLFPVIHRSYIYFIAGKERQVKFKENPLKYISVEFCFPLITFKVSVSGPPKCGKTTLAARIADKFGLKMITRGQAARYVINFLPLSDLAKNMESVLRKGWELTDEMIVKCIEAASFDGKAVTQARRVPVPDERFDYLCEYFKPVSKVPAFLNVVDIAGLVKGASEGQGLGNAFLSHISACDAIFHLCRAFEDDDVTHVEGEVNPVRDLDIICEELRLKDEDTLMKNLEKLERTVLRGGDKKQKPEHDTLQKVKQVLVDEKKHIRFADWDGKDIEVLNKYLFLTSKPALYLVNLSEKDYIKKKNKWLIKIKEWVDKNDPGSIIIPFSGAFENKLLEEYEDPALRKKFLEDNNTTSALDKIIVQGYKALKLEYFFTAGPDEVKAWTIQKGTKAPQAAGRIHTDFEKGFIMAEVMKFDDFKEEGTEAACKAAGKYRQQGRNYVVEDGDIIFFKFNAGAGLQQAKKK